MIEVCRQYLLLWRYCDSGIDVHYAASASLLCILANVCRFLCVMVALEQPMNIPALGDFAQRLEKD